MNRDSSQRQRQEEEEQCSLPLSVVFEGKSWKLTVLLHTTIAIWLVVLVNDRDGFLFIPFRYGHWTSRIVFYVAAFVAAICQAALAVGVLSLNLKPVTQTDWRRRACRSGFALFLIDMMAFEYMGFAADVIFLNKGDLVSVPAMAFASFIGTVFAISFNVIYIRKFGCCTCCCCQCCFCGKHPGAHLLDLAEKWEYEGHRYPFSEGQIQGCSLSNTSNLKAASSQSIRETLSNKRPELSEETRSVRQDTRSEHVELTMTHTETEERIELGSSNAPLTTVSEMEQEEEIQEEVQTVTLKPPSEERVLRKKSRESKPQTVHMRKWDTMQLVEIGSNRLSGQQLHPQEVSRDFESIEEEPENTSESRESDRRPPAASDVLGIVRRFFSKEESEGVPIGWTPRTFWHAIREEPGRFRYAVWIKSAFLTSVVVLIYSFIRTMSIVHHLANLYAENRDMFNSNSDEFDIFLKNAGWPDGIDSITRTVVVKIYLLVDAVLMDSKIVALVGYSFGTAVGLWSLITVLIQHKRMSLAISEGLRALNGEGTSTEKEAESPWLGFQKKYPILGACVFLAILSSTATVQLHIVGILSSLLLGVIVNFTKASILLDIFGYYVLAFLVVILVDISIKRFLQNWLVSADGAHIKRPRWFNFFIVVLSMVNLVVGLLLALMRLVYLLVTTIIILNRLDITLFTFGKQLDNGHNAFMSMLVLTVLVQEDRESFHAQSKTEPSVELSEL